MKQYALKIMLALMCISLFVTACDRGKLLKKLQEESMKSHQEMLDKAMHNPDLTWNQYVAMSNMLGEIDYDELLEDYKNHHYGDMQELPEDISLEFYPARVCEGLYPIFKDAQKVKLGAPFEALDKAAEEYVKAVEDFKPLLLKLSRYVDSKEYIDDNGKLLQESDAEFIRLAENYVNAVSNFMEAQIAANKIKVQQKIDAFNKLGEVREVAALEVYLAMSELFDVIADNDEIDDKFKSDFDKSIANIKAKIDAFEETNSKVSDNVSSQYESLVGQASTFLGSVRDYKQALYEFGELDSKVQNTVKDAGAIDESGAGNKKNKKDKAKLENERRKAEAQRKRDLAELEFAADDVDRKLDVARRYYESYVTTLNGSISRIRR